MTLFIGGTGLPLIELSKVSAVHSVGGVLFAVVEGVHVRVEEDRDRFMAEYLKFKIGEPAKAKSELCRIPLP